MMTTKNNFFFFWWDVMQFKVQGPTFQRNLQPLPWEQKSWKKSHQTTKCHDLQDHNIHMQCTLYKVLIKHNSLFDKQFIIKKNCCVKWNISYWITHLYLKHFSIQWLFNETQRRTSDACTAILVLSIPLKYNIAQPLLFPGKCTGLKQILNMNGMQRD